MRNPNELLEEAAKTYKEKSAEYGDNYKQIGGIMAKFFPKGLSPLNDTTSVDFAEYWNRFHLWFMILIKLTRLSQSNFNHVDSCRDIAVYAAMLEAMSNKGERK